jgi:hypothetical protein
MSKIDFDGSMLRFDPNDPNFVQDLEGDIPAFKEFQIPEIKSDDMRRRLFTWIVIMYDLHTPLRTEIKSLYDRKTFAGSIVGFRVKLKTGQYAPWIEEMFLGKRSEVNDLVVKYISSFASPEYQQLMAHAENQQVLLKAVLSGASKKETLEQIDKSAAVISKLTNFLYGSGDRDEVYEARRALYKQVAIDLGNMKPESVAKAIEEGGLDDEFNPYEDGYMPGDINFVGDDESIADESEK